MSNKIIELQRKSIDSLNELVEQLRQEISRSNLENNELKVIISKLEFENEQLKEFEDVKDKFERLRDIASRLEAELN